MHVEGSSRHGRRGLLLLSAVLLVATACATPGPPLDVRFPGRAPSLPGLIPTPDPLPPGAPGTLIASEPVANNPQLGGATAHRILYRSTDGAGSTIAVSGYVVVPPGTPPVDGWPVLSWAHGTAGLTDACAPSRDPAARLYGDTSYDNAAALVAAGVMVVATDYQGLGTDGPHLYLDGASEGRAVIDAARAAAAFGGSNRVAIEGFSQGGQAALFAGRLAPTYSPELDVVGTLAVAPASHISLVKLLQPLTGFQSFSSYPGMYAYGLLAANPSLNAGDLLEPSGVEQLSDLDDSTCSWSWLQASDFRTDFVQLPSWYAAMARNEPGAERIAGSVVVVQGTDDLDVPAIASSLLCGELGANGTSATLWSYPGVNHVASVIASRTDRERWVLERFARSPSVAPGGAAVQVC